MTRIILLLVRFMTRAYFIYGRVVNNTMTIQHLVTVSGTPETSAFLKQNWLVKYLNEVLVKKKKRNLSEVELNSLL